MGVEAQPDKPCDVSVPLLLLKEQFGEDILETSLPQGDATAAVRAENLVKVVTYLKNDPRLLFNFLVDITAVDWLGRKPRYEVVYHLLSISLRRRLRIKVGVDDAQPAVDTITPLYGSANWLEREVWDMFGIRFRGHPDLRRILLYDEFQGHQLRKDYPIRKRQPRIGPKN